MNAPAPFNRSVWATTSALACTLAVAGFHHGLFEALQGNRRTPGALIDSIGPEHIRWIHGTDPAFTIVPNFLITGLLAMGVSVAIVVWCFTGLRRRHGAATLLTLFILLTLVGGGIGHIVFFLSLCAWAAWVNRPVPRWAGWSQGRTRGVLTGTWLGALISSCALFLAALEVSVFGAGPVVPDPERLLALIGLMLLLAFLTLHAAYVGAIARDRRAGAQA